VQQNLYIGFGPLAAVVEPLGILLTWAMVFMLRQDRPAFWLALLAALCVTAGLVVWALVVSPMNTRLNGWTPATLPADWIASRDQWELGHAVHAMLFGVAFCALLATMLTMPRR
jgi:cytochrome b561